jgi:hypothetical protein
MGLSRQHHGELNKVNIDSSRYDELRQRYSNDPRALQQIDVYDPSSEYRRIFRKYRDALLVGDTQTIRECEEWFRENYSEL